MTTIEMQRYVKEGGTRCPNCGSRDLEGRSVEINAGHATQSVDCLGCGAAWYEKYQLVRIEPIIDGTGYEQRMKILPTD
jgi:predicted nucleic-acid-binding Zn-ribbon protein